MTAIVLSAMARSHSQSESGPALNSGTGQSDQPTGDPWLAFGYLVSGVALYGLAGWAADRLLGTSGLVVIGILIGAGLGTYQTWARFKAPIEDSVKDGN